VGNSIKLAFKFVGNKKNSNFALSKFINKVFV
jgi:hypothetical protein